MHLVQPTALPLCGWLHVVEPWRSGESTSWILQARYQGWLMVGKEIQMASIVPSGTGSQPARLFHVRAHPPSCPDQLNRSSGVLYVRPACLKPPLLQRPKERGISVSILRSLPPVLLSSLSPRFGSVAGSYPGQIFSAGPWSWKLLHQYCSRMP